MTIKPGDAVIFNGFFDTVPQDTKSRLTIGQVYKVTRVDEDPGEAYPILISDNFEKRIALRYEEVTLKEANNLPEWF